MPSVKHHHLLFSLEANLLHTDFTKYFSSPVQANKYTDDETEMTVTMETIKNDKTP